MPIVKKSRTVNYTCEQMFSLVNEVERYAEFLPYCAESLVHHRDEDEVQATLIIGAAGMSKSFTTRNMLQVNKMIEIRLVDGPFSHLEGFWRFDEVEEGCKISFDLEFEFAGRMFSMLLGPVFEQVTDKMVDSFCERAKAIYGQS
ncbi:type II toxin-antitoxin system RatA family toxin [Fluoribacter gormanii]|uniref:Ribosome association toxin PasT (RatA) of the RatAB toxin-antitoxin module n=1 Tax=Fluoribacter gormanii TaxID=464 RepID=A0A377GMD4_9GAMM|nr:type II toxin-antitoxin system RatA family toxin [Fluoribacter gormanii]KTD05742.1 oligoketide cyclase/lipid transporter protein [Fluoribacter gormanii]MCW8442474.1 type II toxin-antitoxin system RatA family toxin [Fluoribacter gormanii]MCW8470961.1 type II toxin-antitoxin system RatA family toxin [Fluoribacter gormanii]SIQ61502.1 Ribosome association toxin PasT (RatA) of the RatAB toxin-antitoxin module [Fluoribacter gormanii]STO25918.1 Ribosome association toxin RatA [Fluoribacter gormani